MLYRFYMGAGWLIQQPDREGLMNLAKYWANAAFGGYTLHGADGGWVGPDGKPEVEPVCVWEVLTHDKLAVGQFRDYLATTFHQQKVLVVELAATEVG